MKLQVQFSADDYIDAIYLHMGLYRMVKILVMMTLGLVICGYAFFSEPHQSGRDYIMPAFFLALVVFLAALLFWFIPKNVRKAFQQQKTLHGIHEMELTPERMQATSPHGNASIPWSDFHKYKIGKKIILVYQPDNLFHMFPRRWFTEEQFTEFKGYLQSALGNSGRTR